MSAANPPISAIPSPVTFAPSQDWDGNDGPWSSFALRVGNPAQDVKVLISTSGYQTWTVAPQGCTSSDPSSCPASRGNFFNPKLSESWRLTNFTSNSTFVLGLEGNLGYDGNGIYGFDDLGLDWQGSAGPDLDGGQLLATITTKEFYLGIFGLDPRPSNFTNFDHPVPSILSNLFNQSVIPSLAWGYTAGNQYRNQQVLGSLTLGGFEQTRLIPNSVFFPFDPIENRALSVVIHQISFQSSNATSVLLDEEAKLSALIDSTIPYIYLPLEICRKFENAFGIEWNETVQAYFVNDTTHLALQGQNASVTFSLGTIAGPDQINISLPYAAFDLTASPPLVTLPSRYFPLVRAQNSSQYTLGRTFLQEAYLTADFERRNFSVSQCNWDIPTNQDVQTIVSPKYVNHTTTGSPKPTSSSSSASSHRSSRVAELAGGITGGVLGLLASSILAVLIFKRILRHAKPAVPVVNVLPEAPAEEKPGLSEIDNNAFKGHQIDGEPYVGAELEYRPIHEAHNSDFPQHELGALPSDSRLLYRNHVFELPDKHSVSSPSPTSPESDS